MADLISDSFAGILKRNRNRINARFAAEAAVHTELKPAQFKRCLVQMLQPALAALGDADPALVDHTLDLLVELVLKLLTSGFIGEQAKYPQYEELWAKLIAGQGHLLRDGGGRFAPAMANAFYNLARDGTVRIEEWLTLTADVLPRCGSVAAALAAGNVTAWRAGAAYLRPQAMTALRSLEPALSLHLLGLSEAADLEPVLDAMEQDPWLTPPAAAADGTAPRALKIVARVGAFRGFGGLLREPPLVYLDSAGHVVVFDGEGSWGLEADCFGASLRPTAAAGGASPKESSDAGFNLNAAGKVRCAGGEALFPQLAGALSHVSTPHMCAVTIPRSHAVHLVAYAPVQ